MNQLTFENVSVRKVDKPQTKQPIGCMAPMCAECIEFTGKFTGKRCPGKTRAEVLPGVRPCRKYDFDMAILEVTEI